MVNGNVLWLSLLGYGNHISDETNIRGFNTLATILDFNQYGICSLCWCSHSWYAFQTTVVRSRNLEAVAKDVDRVAPTAGCYFLASIARLGALHQLHPSHSTVIGSDGIIYEGPEFVLTAEAILNERYISIVSEIRQYLRCCGFSVWNGEIGELPAQADM